MHFFLYSSISNRLIPILDIRCTVQDHSRSYELSWGQISFVVSKWSITRNRNAIFPPVFKLLVIGWSQCWILGILSKITQHHVKLSLDPLLSYQNHFVIENGAPTITKVAVIPNSIIKLGQCWRSGVLSKLLHHQGTLARKHKLSYGNDLDH